MTEETDPFQVEIEKFNEEVLESAKRLSNMRKKGYDMKLPAIRMMNLPAKLKMAAVTKDRMDLIRARRILRVVMDEIFEIERQGLNPKYKHDPAELKLTKLNQLVTSTKYYLDVNDVAGAESEFAKMGEVYRELDKPQKKEMYKRCMRLFEQIEQMREGTQGK